MKQTQTIPETFLGVGYTRDRAGLPLEAVRVPVPQPAADQVLIRIAASSLNPLEYKLADLNFMGRTPPVVLGLDLADVVVAVGHGVSGVAVGDAVAAMADLNADGGWVATGSGGEGGYAVARQFLTVRKPPSLSFRDAAALLCVELDQGREALRRHVVQLRGQAARVHPRDARGSRRRRQRAPLRARQRGERA